MFGIAKIGIEKKINNKSQNKIKNKAQNKNIRKSLKNRSWKATIFKKSFYKSINKLIIY